VGASPAAVAGETWCFIWTWERKSYEEMFKVEFNLVKAVGPRHWLLHGSLYSQPLWDTVTRRQVPDGRIVLGMWVEEPF